MNSYEAIFKRQSIRRYANKPLDQDTLRVIQTIIDSRVPLYPEINLQIRLVEDGQAVQRVMSGILGELGKVRAPHYLIVSSEEKPGYLPNLGYTVEDVVLHLTAMGIATCWIGGHFKEEVVRDFLALPKAQKPILFIAFGLPEREDLLYRTSPTAAKRKKVEEIATGKMDNTWKQIMEAVRIAPSAANSQPWQFIIEGHVAHTYCQKPSNFLMRKFLGSINLVDMGIGLNHVQVAASHLGKKVSFRKMDKNPATDGEYITSLVLE